MITTSSHWPPNRLKGEIQRGGSSAFFSRVKATSLKEHLTGQMQAAIFRGDLPPGSRIVQTELAKQMEVSQATVREAIQELANEGFVIQHANRQTLVRTFIAEDLKKTFDLRAELEAMAAKLVSESTPSEAGLAPLCEIVDQM